MSRIIVALDTDNYDKAITLAESLKGLDVLCKVGKELFTAVGPVIIRTLTEMGIDVFLDLKYHDIPNTVGKAVKAACAHGVKMLNVHASGGRAMLKFASESADEAGEARPLVLGVTVLTSLDTHSLKNDLGCINTVDEQGEDLAVLCHDEGLDGVVCSPQEVALIREGWPEAVIVTPGIRPEWSVKKDDQKRITTPADAVRGGSDYLVIGRPITGADDPLKAVLRIATEIETAKTESVAQGD